MDKDMLIRRLNAMDGSDKECEHGAADEFMLDFLRANGYADVADAYDAARERAGGWWYA